MYSGEKVLVGLEHGKAADYAMRLNLAAQINLVDAANEHWRNNCFCNQPSCALLWNRIIFAPGIPKMARQFKSQLPGLGFQQRP